MFGGPGCALSWMWGRVVALAATRHGRDLLYDERRQHERGVVRARARVRMRAGEGEGQSGMKLMI